MYCLILCSTASAHAELINLGHRGKAELDQIVTAKNLLESPAKQVVWLSSLFVDTPYAANTLVGGPQETEQLVLDLEQFDCFTYLDVIESFRRARDFNDLLNQLKNVRYVDGVVAYTNRRHFFSDWAHGSSEIDDVTSMVGGDKSLRVLKSLNRKADGSAWLTGIATKPRQINFIPTASVNEGVLNGLHPGDYVGIYSELAGLDVSHTGLIVKKNGEVKIRHASSRRETNRVVDEDLMDYLQGKPGIVVYRVKP